MDLYLRLINSEFPNFKYYANQFLFTRENEKQVRS